MIKKNPLSKTPGRKNIDKFIEGGNQSKERKKPQPWDNADPEIVKLFNLRLPKPLKIKLEYIVQNTLHTSIHSFIMDEVEKAVNKELKKLGVEE